MKVESVVGKGQRQKRRKRRPKRLKSILVIFFFISNLNFNKKKAKNFDKR